MAPPPEYDKEPKAPDKSVTNNSSEDSKVVYNHLKDHPANTESKISNTIANVDVENNKHVEALDDGQLRALLDEAITYKCPKDREGKSSLFKELLEEVEQDEQACEEAARAGRNARRARARREHHSSLQDLVAAMAGEAAPRRGRAHAHSHAPAPPAGTVSARALHGGSLPSGVDTSFLLGEESGVGMGVGVGVGAGAARGGYLATVRCVNPPPLAERRVSTGDATAPQPQPPPPPAQELDVITRRSKPIFPMTYTARATLEIGSGSVGSGRAVTTTTASNQKNVARVGGGATREWQRRSSAESGGTAGVPRGPNPASEERYKHCNSNRKAEDPTPNRSDAIWVNTVNSWYGSLDRYSYRATTNYENMNTSPNNYGIKKLDLPLSNDRNVFDNNKQTIKPTSCNNIVVRSTEKIENKKLNNYEDYKYIPKCDNTEDKANIDNENESDTNLRKQYRERVGNDLIPPNKAIINPRNFRSLTVGKPPRTVQNNETKKPARKLDKMSVENNNLSTDKTEQTLNLNKSDEVSSLKIASIPSRIKNPSLSYEIVVDDDNSLNAEIMNMSDKKVTSKTIADFELADMPLNSEAIDKSKSFVEYVAHHHKLIKNLEVNNNEENPSNFNENTDIANEPVTSCTEEINCKISCQKIDGKSKIETIEPQNNSTEIALSLQKEEHSVNDQYVTAELPNNAYILLTFAKSFFTNPYNINKLSKVQEIVTNDNSTNTSIDRSGNTASKKDKKKSKQPKPTVNAKKEGINKNALKMLLYSERPEKTNYSKQKLSTCEDKVDSAIAFSCITTPEVVTSCNTTSSTSQTTVAVDPKPLQLVSSYRAVACLMDGACRPRPPSPPQPHAAPAQLATAAHQPRGAISSSFNGLPLARPAPADDYKKSLDENGNAVQGFGSPLSGSGQHKKPRRKKSSKNETVIKSHQIDGYQGNKDLNEVLRFIESNAEGARAPKLRPKHKDDADDKAGKKRSTERRKDKDSEPKRASSLEELSRTKLEDLTDKPAPRDAPGKPERRSWGADARAPLEPEPPELADFQTVTKKRKPRRRADDAERAPSPPRRARAPSPRSPPRASAPASERSNDSADDADRALSPPPAPPPPQASYADIARTRHNIPDLIESCNFYAEGDEPPAAAAPPDDAEQYPALAARRARDKPAEAPRAPRKEPPAPDVVADRRPPVVLLAAGARPRDMDGVTFGFDVNEQLLGARCDLLEHGAVAVRAGCAALRYVPPAPPPPDARLHLLVDYVAAAWEDVMRGGGKVHYFSECAARAD